MVSADDPPDRPDCARCAHFFVTWEPEHPQGCRAYGFRAKSEPSAVVLRESGQACQLFEQKAPPRPGSGPSASEPGLWA
jgi:hypothetical protein